MSNGSKTKEKKPFLVFFVSIMALAFIGGMLGGAFPQVNAWVHIHDDAFAAIIGIVSTVIGAIYNFGGFQRSASMQIVVEKKSKELLLNKPVDPTDEKSIREFINKIDERVRNERK